MDAVKAVPDFDLLGCDFSSSPSRRKPVVLALGRSDGQRVQLQALVRLETLAALSTWLAQPRPWVGGFDLPFGLPRELVTTLHWPTDWRACMQHYRSLTRAHRMIRGIRAGVVWVNTYRAVSPIAPFGGHGLSGHGREGGLAAALDYTTVKTVWLRTSDEPIPDPFVMR